MRTRGCPACVLSAVFVILVSNPTIASESIRLAAPVYPGAVPAVPAEGFQANPALILSFAGGKTLDCNGIKVARDMAGREIAPEQAGPVRDYAGPWCFLTKDPIDKVKAFYEKSIGKLQAVQGENGIHGYEAFTERAWFPGEGEAIREGYSRIGVSMHALGPPPVEGQTPAAPAMGDEQWAGQEAYAFYVQTRFFGAFLDGVDYLGDPSKRPTSDLDALYQQRKYLESAFFQHKAPDFKTADVLLTKQYESLRAERQKEAIMANISALQHQSATAPTAGPTAEEDAQFNRVMQDDPALRRQYMELTQQGMALMQQGKEDEANAVFDQIDELEASHPELAAMSAQQNARSAQAAARSAAGEDDIMKQRNARMDQAVWGTGLEMLDALDKAAYYTLIVIDTGYDGTEKDYSTDRNIIDAETAGTIPHQSVDAYRIAYPEAGPDVTAGGGGQEAAPGEKEKESVKDKAKKGLSKLLGH